MMWLDCVIEAPLSVLGTGYPSLHKNSYHFGSIYYRQHNKQLVIMF
jgi:hypothetical protein